MKQFVQNEEAVSPVIGVILMVAITVILAAVIAMFVFNMADEVSGPKDVVITSSTDGTATTILLQAGSGLKQIKDISIKWNSTVLKSSATNVTRNGVAIGADKTSIPGPFSVGDVITLTDKSSGTLVLTANFTDGDRQVISQKTFS